MSKDEALQQQMTLTAQKPVDPRDLSFLQEWMARPSMGNVYLIGRDSDIWSSPTYQTWLSYALGTVTTCSPGGYQTPLWMRIIESLEDSFEYCYWLPFGLHQADAKSDRTLQTGQLTQSTIRKLV